VKRGDQVRDARKLYKIELRDNSGFHRGLTSSKKSTPVASGVYKRLPVALGSELRLGWRDAHIGPNGGALIWLQRCL
jgi:hypothetical protein